MRFGESGEAFVLRASSFLAMRTAWTSMSARGKPTETRAVRNVGIHASTFVVHQLFVLTEHREIKLGKLMPTNTGIAEARNPAIFCSRSSFSFINGRSDALMSSTATAAMAWNVGLVLVTQYTFVEDSGAWHGRSAEPSRNIRL